MGKYTFEDMVRIRLEWRGIDEGCECAECTGSGVKLYGDTSTWQRGIGGQAMTMDVCDHCWGSGDKDRPWPSRRTAKHHPTQ